MARRDDTPLAQGLRLAHLRLIAALDEHRRISGAATALNMTQPAASRMLAEMERILGAPLCERLPRGVGLTPAGEACARRARAVLAEIDAIDREVRDLNTGGGGSATVGAVTAPAIRLLVPAVAALRAERPGAQVTMEVDTSVGLVRDLIAARFDFILGRVPAGVDPRAFDVREIGVERACFLVRRGHPLADQDGLTLADLLAFDWVLQPGGSMLRDAVETALLAAGLAPPARFVATSSLLLTLVLVTRTDSIVPVAAEVAEFVESGDGLAGEIAVLKVDPAVTVRPFSLIRLKDRTLPPVAARLETLVLAVARDWDR